MEAVKLNRKLINLVKQATIKTNCGNWGEEGSSRKEKVIINVEWFKMKSNTKMLNVTL